jgi:hypothetical protein
VGSHAATRGHGASVSVLLLDSIPARAERLFELACERDLEGIVAKWSKGIYIGAMVAVPPG